MILGWKVLIPAALLNIMVTGALTLWRSLREEMCHGMD